MKIKFCLKKILDDRGLGVIKFAEIAGVHYQTIINICHNRTSGISLATLGKVCTALDIEPGELFMHEVIEVK
ncbi:MAG: helix-turn-helix transcriptional regulator [Chloroflexota bacterium]